MRKEGTPRKMLEDRGVALFLKDTFPHCKQQISPRNISRILPGVRIFTPIRAARRMNFNGIPAADARSGKL